MIERGDVCEVLRKVKRNGEWDWVVSVAVALKDDPQDEADYCFEGPCEAKIAAPGGPRLGRVYVALTEEPTDRRPPATWQ